MLKKTVWAIAVILFIAGLFPAISCAGKKSADTFAGEKLPYIASEADRAKLAKAWKTINKVKARYEKAPGKFTDMSESDIELALCNVYVNFGAASGRYDFSKAKLIGFSLKPFRGGGKFMIYADLILGIEKNKAWKSTVRVWNSDPKLIKRGILVARL